jgi:acyl-CoA thioester hydrolase
VSELILTYRGAVYPWHCDHIGHMNVMWYVGKFDEATWNLFSMAGITPAYLREQRRGMAAVQQNIAYKRELKAGDVVVIRSGVLEVREKLIRFCHEMRNAVTDDVSAITVLTGAHLPRSPALTKIENPRFGRIVSTGGRETSQVPGQPLPPCPGLRPRWSQCAEVRGLTPPYALVLPSAFKSASAPSLRF